MNNSGDTGIHQNLHWIGTIYRNKARVALILKNIIPPTPTHPFTPANIAFQDAGPNKWEWEPFNPWRRTVANTASQGRGMS